MLEINKIYHMDCIEGMKLLDKECIDLVVTSPPYDNLRSYNDSSEWNFDVFKKVASELFRTIKRGGVVVWVVGDSTVDGSETGTSFRQALYFKELGFNIHDTMIYAKNASAFPANIKSKRYTQIFEYMFIFSKGAPKTSNLICDKPNKWARHTNWGKNTDRQTDGTLKVKADIKPVPDFSPRNNIWRYVVGGGIAQSDKIAYKHPATFPDKLAQDHIISWSDKGDVVLDPFIGSGTTALASIDLDRNFIGFEIDKTYFKLANDRIADARMQIRFDLP